MEIENKVISPLIKEKMVSELTGMSLATLRNHRWLGKGIPYIKIGRRCLQIIICWDFPSVSKTLAKRHKGVPRKTKVGSK